MALERRGDALGRVLRSEGLDAQAPGETRVEGAVATQGEALVELWQADEDQGEQGEAIPVVVHQQVQHVQRLLGEQV